MSGGVAGGLGGAALGSIVPGVGTALGATLGGLAGTGISQLGGGGGSTSPAAQPVSTNQGTFQSYTPQAQQQQDYTWQGLQNQLTNLAWGGLNQLGGVSPATQLYPQVAQDASSLIYPDPGVAGSYGSYGGQAVQGAVTSAQDYQNILASPQNLLNYGTQAGAAGLNALPQVSGAAFNPQIGQTVQNVISNPYFQQQLSGAQAGSQIGGQAAGYTPQQIQLLNQLGGTLPGLGQQAAATTQAQIPLLQNLAQNQAGYGAGLAGQAQGLLPGMQQIGAAGQQLASAAPRYAQAAGATTPQLQQIGATGQGLSGAAPGFAQGMLGTAQQGANIGALGGGLTGAAPGFAQGALGTNAGLAAAQQQILQSGMDPQSALYNRTAQQTLDQQNAINAMSGVGTSPYGAGVAGQTMANFNIDWQNQQLQRQAQAAQAASSLAGQQLAGTTGAANILNQLMTGGANIGLGGLTAQQAGIQGGANLLGGLTSQGGQLGLSAAQQQLANLQAGGGLLQNLTTAGGTQGLNALQQQLAGLTGAGNLYNQGAQGAGTLAQAGGTLAGQGLQQQLNAAQGAGDLYGAGLNLGQGGATLSALAGAMPSQAYLGQQQAGLNALNMQNQMAGAGATNLANLTTQLGTAGQMPISGLTAANQFSAQPYNTSLQQAQNAMTALTNQASFGNQMLQLPQSVLANAQAYMTGGQQASQIAGLLGLQNQQATALQNAGLGSLLGLGSNILNNTNTGNALSNAFGSASSGTGLLGSISNLFQSPSSIPPPGNAFTTSLLNAPTSNIDYSRDL
jgi:hypothetical protein